MDREPLVWWPARWRLQRLDRALDPLLKELPVNVPAFEHEIGLACGLDRRIGAMALHDQIGGCPNFAVRNHLPAVANAAAAVAPR
jgi:hypothetical protein